MTTTDTREARETKVIAEYRIETLRHAANVIFNKLNEVYTCGTNTDQGRQALFDAQTCADLIVASQNSTALIAPSRPSNVEMSHARRTTGDVER